MKYWSKNSSFYLIILIVVAAVYSNTVSNGYNLDDEMVTRLNPNTTIETEKSLLDLFKSNYHSIGNFNYGYRPVSVASFFLEHKFFGESARTSHSINLILFGVLCALIFKMLRLVFNDKSSFILLFITLLFVVHSVHSEVVASIKNRDEILALLFFTLAVLASLSWLFKSLIYKLPLIILLISLSILSKKSTIPVIFLVPLFFLVKRNLKFRQFGMLSLSCGIPLAFFTFNFKLMEGAIVLFTFLIFHSSFFYIRRYFIAEKWTMKKIVFYTVNASFTATLLLLSLKTQELAIWAISLIVVLVFFKRHTQGVYLAIIIYSLLGLFVFEKVEIVMFAIVLFSSLVFQKSLFSRSRWLIPIVVAVLVCIATYMKADFIFLLIYSSSILLFYTKYLNRYLPLMLSVVFLVCSIVFGFFNIFLVGILLYSFLPLVGYSKVGLFNWAFSFTWIILFSAVLIIGHVSDNAGLIKSEAQVSRLDNLPQNINEATLEEGRKLEFIENTLMAPHRLDQRLATGLVVLGEYIRVMVFPKELSFYYGYSKINTTDFTNYRVWLSLFAYVFILFLGICFFKNQPLISTGAFWYLASIFIFSNIPVLVAGMVGERLAFSASLGFCLMFGGVVNWVKPEFSYKKIRGLELLSILLLVVFSVRTFARNEQWESHIKLMSNDIEHLENSAQANYLLAIHSIKEAEQSAKGGPVDMQKVNVSIGYFKKAIEIYSSYYNFHIDLGKAYLVMRQPELAKASFLVADRLEPNALLGLFELAKVSFTLKEYEEVIKHSEGYLEQSTFNPTIYELAAFSAYYMDDYSIALGYAEEGVKQFPSNQVLRQLIPDIQRRILE